MAWETESSCDQVGFVPAKESIKENMKRACMRYKKDRKQGLVIHYMLRLLQIHSSILLTRTVSFEYKLLAEYCCCCCCCCRLAVFLCSCGAITAPFGALAVVVDSSQKSFHSAASENESKLGGVVPEPWLLPKKFAVSASSAIRGATSWPKTYCDNSSVLALGIRWGCCGIVDEDNPVIKVVASCDDIGGGCWSRLLLPSLELLLDAPTA